MRDQPWLLALCRYAPDNAAVDLIAPRHEADDDVVLGRSTQHALDNQVLVRVHLLALRCKDSMQVRKAWYQA